MPKLELEVHTLKEELETEGLWVHKLETRRELGALEEVLELYTTEDALGVHKLEEVGV